MAQVNPDDLGPLPPEMGREEFKKRYGFWTEKQQLALSLEEVSHRTLDKQCSWDEFYLHLAFFWGQRSCETSSRNACVVTSPDNVVLSQGYVGMPRGVEPNWRRLNERPYKYFWHEHAERNAINNAARQGVALNGCTFYITGDPCASCARGIVSVGCERLVLPQQGYFTDRKNDAPESDWTPSLEAAKELLKDARVDVVYINIGDLTEFGENNPLVKDGSGPNV